MYYNRLTYTEATGKQRLQNKPHHLLDVMHSNWFQGQHCDAATKGYSLRVKNKQQELMEVLLLHKCPQNERKAENKIFHISKIDYESNVQP